MKRSSPKKKNEIDRTKSDAIVARILAKGGWENPLGLPGWRWFQFDTNIDARNWFVHDDGTVKAGRFFREAEKIKIEGNI